ncbi:hypothetical protein MASR1M60_33320 [Rhodocyclaceae bacterium]
MVEDNAVNRRVIEAMLGKLKLVVDSVENGAEALEALAAPTDAQQPPYDLVFMDVQMPVMDGIEATKQFRVRETQTGAPHLPIVALAAGAYDEDRQHCLAAGMDDFLTKPINIRQLHQILAKWLGA